VAKKAEVPKIELLKPKTEPEIIPEMNESVERSEVFGPNGVNTERPLDEPKKEE